MRVICYHDGMVRLTSVYICQQCGFQSPQFLGKCPQCQSWNSLVEQVSKGSTSIARQVNASEVVYLKDIDQGNHQRLSTSIGEFDRVLGGGIVTGSIILVSGDPGIGKSTLLTQLALNINQRLDVRSEKLNDPLNVLYVSGEESAQQIKIRAERLMKGANLAILNEVDVDILSATIEKFKPKLAIVDSIQTLETLDLTSAPGSLGQVRECAHRLQRLAKATHIPIILVGHVTKEGSLAGPRTLEHLVDVVLSLEGDPAHFFRVLRSTKNRFGPTDEVGIFDMEETGLVEVENPSKLFLDSASRQTPGSVVVATLNGVRPLLVEIQALVAKTPLPIARRVGSGIDNNRLQLLVATLTKRLNLPLYQSDIFVNVTGGLRIDERAADLGICMAIVSSLKEKAVNPKIAFVGEVGLLGELRAVRQIEKRANEAKKLGFAKVVSPSNAKSLSEAVKLVLP